MLAEITGCARSTGKGGRPRRRRSPASLRLRVRKHPLGPFRSLRAVLPSRTVWRAARPSCGATTDARLGRPGRATGARRRIRIGGTRAHWSHGERNCWRHAWSDRRERASRYTDRACNRDLPQHSCARCRSLRVQKGRTTASGSSCFARWTGHDFSHPPPAISPFLRNAISSLSRGPYFFDLDRGFKAKYTAATQSPAQRSALPVVVREHAGRVRLLQDDLRG